MIPRRPMTVRGITPSQSTAPPVAELMTNTAHIAANIARRNLVCSLCPPFGFISLLLIARFQGRGFIRTYVSRWSLFHSVRGMGCPYAYFVVRRFTRIIGPAPILSPDAHVQSDE